jgi:hypothetical protein
MFYLLQDTGIGASDSPIGGVVFFPALILFFSVYLGGIPYLLMLAGLFVWMRGKTAASVQRMTYFLPLLYIPVFSGCTAIFIFFKRLLNPSSGPYLEIDLQHPFAFILLCDLFILVVGFCYVVAMNTLFQLFKWLRTAGAEQIP